MSNLDITTSIKNNNDNSLLSFMSSNKLSIIKLFIYSGIGLYFYKYHKQNYVFDHYKEKGRSRLIYRYLFSVFIIEAILNSSAIVLYQIVS